MRSLRTVGAVALAVVAVTSSASAQRARRAPSSSSSSSSTSTLWEIGADAGLGFTLAVPSGDRKVTSLSVPLQSIRAGFFINQDWSLEPSLGYSYTKIEGVDGISLLQLGFAGLYHLTPDRTHRQVYVRPFLGFLSASSGGNSNSDEQLGVGVGMKWPKLNGRMAWRGEVNIDHTFDAEVTALNLLFGISFFTR